MARGRKARRIILYFLLGLTGVLLAAAVWFYFAYGRSIIDLYNKAADIVASSDRSDFKASETTLCYFSDGSLMSVLKGEKDVYYLTYDSIPEAAIDAMLVTEDRKFYRHTGYDFSAIMRAVRAYLINRGEIHQGGSTITQQLARNIYLTNEVTVERKLTEIFIAIGLEKKYTKKEILEFYLNNIYFANGHYGLQAAANGYFSKSAGELSLSQLMFLCAIPNNPTKYNPYTGFEQTMQRRDNILLQMVGGGLISEVEYREALEEEIVMSSHAVERSDYAETFTYYSAVRALMSQNGFTFRHSFADEADRELYEESYYDLYYRLQRTLYTGGYRVYTSIDREKQELLADVIADQLAFETNTNNEGIYKLQSSAVCIDNDTGMVVAIAGGREQEYEGYTLNRAYQSPRQPGSAIKPLIVYTPLFERGYYPDSTVVDERFEGGPRNSSDVYSGEIDVRYAVMVSKNTVAWKLFDELKPAVGLQYLLDMGFNSIVPADYVPAASLGGLTYGTTALEMTSAYAAIENDGIYRTPTCIELITDSSGQPIVTGDVSEKSVYSQNAARIMTDVLQSVMQDGTGRRSALEGIDCAGKTGTTNDQKDGWFVGYTRYYTTGVWVGYDMPKKMDDLMGNTYPAYIWNQYMEAIHEGLKNRAFEPYTDMRPSPTPEEDPGDEEDMMPEDDEAGEDVPPKGEEAGEDVPPEGEEAGEDISPTPDASGTIWIRPGGESDTTWVKPGTGNN